MSYRAPEVPFTFYNEATKCSKSDLIEIVWVLMMQSPWFDESQALDNPALVGEQVLSIRKANREARRRTISIKDL